MSVVACKPGQSAYGISDTEFQLTMNYIQYIGTYFIQFFFHHVFSMKKYWTIFFVQRFFMLTFVDASNFSCGEVTIHYSIRVGFL